MNSPSAALLMLALGAIVVLQVVGDVRQAAHHIKNKKSKKKSRTINYLADDSLSAGLRASKYALQRYRYRAVRDIEPKLLMTSRLCILWPMVFAACSIIATILWLEGFVAAGIGVLLYIGLMSAVGLLAWPSDTKNSVSQKLAIALMAPYSVFFTFN